jgi:hypothetical protein
MNQIILPAYAEAVAAIHQEWPPIPDRSRLYSLEPEGLGTPLSESAVSYVVRLAHAHNLSMNAFATMVIPRFTSFGERDVPRLDQLGRLNGPSDTYESTIDELQSLTCRDDLNHLTLRPLSEILCTLGLQRRERAWCPLCLEEWHTAGRPVYEPLLWTLQAVRVCPVHGVPLETRCPDPDCATAQPVLPRRGGPGICEHCGTWLGSVGDDDPGNYPSGDEFDAGRVQWVAEQAGLLIAAPTHRREPLGRSAVSRFVRTSGDILTDGNPVVFAQMLGYSPTAVSHWCNGTALPPLSVLLDLSFLVQKPLLSCLDGEKMDADRVILRAVERSTIKKPSSDDFIDVEQMNAVLKYLATNRKAPPSLPAVCRHIGTTPAIFRRHFPSLVASIAVSYEVAQTQNKERRIKRKARRIRKAVVDLLSQGIYPSVAKIHRVLGDSNVLREKWAFRLWRETLDEIGREMLTGMEQGDDDSDKAA